MMEPGGIVPITAFSSTAPDLEVAYDAATVWTKRLRKPDASLHAALAEAQTAVVPAGAAPPTLTPIWGYSFCTSTVCAYWYSVLAALYAWNCTQTS